MSTQTSAKANGAPVAQHTSLTASPLPEFRGELEPAVDLYENDGSFFLECAVPGFKKEDIVVKARGDHVSITGSYAHAKSEKTNHYHRKEMRQASFARTIALPKDIDPERVSARLDNGVLKIELHPVDSIAAKTVPISS